MVKLCFGVFGNFKLCLIKVILFVWRIQARKEEKTPRCWYTGICRRGKFDQCWTKSDQAFHLLLCNRILKFLSLKFGYLLDENAGSKFDNIGMNAMANRDNASKYMLQVAGCCNAEIHFFPSGSVHEKWTTFNWNTGSQTTHSRDSSSASVRPDSFLQWRGMPSAKYLVGVVEWIRLQKRGKGCPWPFHTVSRDRQDVLCQAFVWILLRSSVLDSLGREGTAVFAYLLGCLLAVSVKQKVVFPKQF